MVASSATEGAPPNGDGNSSGPDLRIFLIRLGLVAVRNQQDHSRHEDDYDDNDSFEVELHF